MSTCDNETAFLFHLVSDIYRKPSILIPALQEINIPRLLQISMRNNLGYYVFKTLFNKYGERLTKNTFTLLEDLINRGDNRIMDQRAALLQIKTCLPQCLIYKTFRAHHRIPNDIDILVRNLRQAVNFLKLTGMTLHEYSSHEAVLITDKKIRIQLHSKVSWANSSFLDNELIREKTRTVSFDGVAIRIPNIEADFLIHLAHINFEPLHFTLSDFLYLCKIAPLINWNVVINQARKYHWERTFNHSMVLLDGLHHSLYLDICPFEGLRLEHRAERKGNISLPKSLPKRHIINAFIEKKLFLYTIRRMIKVSRILFSGDTYTPFYLPPERVLLSTQQ